jgi:HlyD family secretion protein
MNGRPSGRPWSVIMKKFFVVLALVLLAGGVGISYWNHSAAPAISFRTAPVARGDLLVTIGATGTVEPVEVIDVGAQVAGKIEVFGNDRNGKPIDYGTAVEQGTILAHIDDSLYAADMEQASALLEQAKANVLRAEADLEQMRAKLHQAENNWKRARELGPSRALSATDYDSYKAAYETAKATVAVGEATAVQARKSVLQAEATVKRARTNLSYCTIRSPVKGVIIDRRVNIGQTVVASLNAPSLFLIAKDLKKLQVWASVNEADIGMIRPGQAVGFTMVAYPGQNFRGQVSKIRLNASMTQNVVNYTVEIDTDNPNGRLLPYLTANVRFEVARRKNVLTVPNAALRWKPLPEQMAGGSRPESSRRGRQKPVFATGTAPAPESGLAAQTRGTIWLKAGSFVRPIDVSVGVTDGTTTEIQGANVKEGMEIVTGESQGAVEDDTTNPFTPKFFGNRPR